MSGNAGTVVALKEPVAIGGGAMLAEVTVRRPTQGDILAANQSRKGREKALTLVGRLTGQTRRTLLAMTVGDFNRIAEAVAHAVDAEVQG